MYINFLRLTASIPVPGGIFGLANRSGVGWLGGVSVWFRGGVRD